MATLVLSAVGAAAGASVGGGVLGLSSVVIGRAVGATLGRIVDQSLLGAGSEAVETGRVDRFRLNGVGQGTAIAQVYGRLRVGGQIIWASRFREDSETSGGGKGAPKKPKVTQFSYSVSLAVGLCEGTISRVGRIWADGREIAPDSLNMRVYPGDQTQLPDPKIEAVEGHAPAYRGLAYVVIEDLQLSQFGNRVPQFTFEVMRPEQEDQAGDVPDLARGVQGVAMMPGTGEYALATTQVRFEDEPGVGKYINVNTPAGKTDFAASLDSLTGELPNCKAASLIVSWFGSDLRCGECVVEPKVEQRAFEGREMPWVVSGVSRDDAARVPVSDGAIVYGGTPTDQSVIEAIKALQEAGQAAMFYPFILMEQLASNGLRDPYTGADDQPDLPWRGRITLSVAPGRDGTPDKTAAARDEVDAFFGAAQPGDFQQSDGTVRYTGPQEWSYRRFILHYAHLCAMVGGLDSFCIGSEMRGLTQIRDDQGFPAVAQMRRLAGEVSAILGPDVKVGYAADWSEYFGYHPQDGSGEVFFHLDPLWADPNIDFIGIDNYMPLSDWRDGDTHADADFGAIYNLDYLKSNIAGGEGFDWYYHAPEARDAQLRTPITDGGYDEPWVFRYKDLKSWWASPHYDRPGGQRQDAPTAWQPGSKPIWFTEIGCAAIDKGTNQPNKFLDPKSSESSIPRFSNGRRDDFIQMQYLRATFDHWGDVENNPVSPVYGGPMVNMERALVWAWDARPYPYFPGNAELWTDSANYARGHWISGRSTARALGSVVREICARSGVTDVDVDALYDLVRGYLISAVEGGRSALQPLMLAYGFDAIERDGKLIFRSRDGRSDAVIDPADVAVSGEVSGDIQTTRMPEADRIGRLKLNFIEAEGDYETESAEAIFPDARSFSVSQSDLPLVLTGLEGREITERWLSEARVARDRAKFALPPSRLDLGAGDVVDLGTSRYRIDHVEQAGMQQIEAVRIEPELYQPSDTVDTAIRVKKFVAPVPVLPVFLDLPLMTGDEIPHAPHIAVTGRPWPGSVAVYDAAGDAGFELNTTLSRAAVVGVTQTQMSAASPGRFDRGTPLRVRLVTGALSSVDPAALLEGRNLMAIGTGDDDSWELFQFGTANLISPQTYDLSFRLRGQLGTDGVMPQIWPVGSRVVLLSDAVPQIGLASSTRGLARTYRVGPAGRPVDDPIYAEDRRAFDGIGLRPYAPAHLKATRVGGDLTVRWIRRTRIDGDTWQGPDVPVGEETESYLVRIVKDGAILREATINQPSWVYGGGQQSADGIAGPFVVQVSQISTRFGPGPATSALVA